MSLATAAQIKSLYVHVPFCAQKCEYCAFFSEASSGELINRYVAALECEIALVAHDLRPQTIFFGGGTPSILNLRQWESLLGTMQRHNLLGAEEFTVECNPATVSLEKAKLLRSFGVNRISMGVQSLDETLLDRLGRVHSREMVFKSFDTLRQAGFDNVNIDLMFAIPGQTMDIWRATLDEALALGSEHLSSYEVIYEEDTPLYAQMKAGEFDVDEDLACDMYEELITRSAKAGFKQYEIANFARDTRAEKSSSGVRPSPGAATAAEPEASKKTNRELFNQPLTRPVGHPLPIGWGEGRGENSPKQNVAHCSPEPTPCPSQEGNTVAGASCDAPLLGGARGGSVHGEGHSDNLNQQHSNTPTLQHSIPAFACRHNMNYWRGGDYHGLGPSATGYVRGVRTKNWSNTQLYCEQLEKGRRAIESSENLVPLKRAAETAAFGLRMNAGWPFDEFNRATGFDLRHEWSADMDSLVQRGWAQRSPECFRLTSEGLRFADTAAELFLR